MEQLQTIEELKQDIKNFRVNVQDKLDSRYPQWLTDNQLDSKIFTLEYFYVLIFDKQCRQEIDRNEYSPAEINWYITCMNEIKDEYEFLDRNNLTSR
jgi:hypothetical protein